MELFTLDPSFQRLDVIDEFESAIWTERYSAAGDVALAVPATAASQLQLSEGTFLGLAGSQEVMMLDTQSIEKGLLKVTGPSLLGFLNERVVRTSGDHQDRAWNITGSPAGVAMGVIVTFACISGDLMNDAADFYHIDGAMNRIPNLSLGPTDNSGPNVTAAIPFGPLYNALKTLAETYEMGMSLYLDSASDTGYSLKFTTYLGVDHTSSQTVSPIVRFSPALNSLTNIKELRSVTGYKTHAYAFATANPGPNGFPIASGKAAAPGMAGALGFTRRVLMLTADDITTETIDGDPAVLQALLNQTARNALANNNFTRVVDGEVVAQSEFQYGTHYKLGDIVELEAQSGFAQRARITEYIRSQDSAGERAYPTVSVLTD